MPHSFKYMFDERKEIPKPPDQLPSQSVLPPSLLSPVPPPLLHWNCSRRLLLTTSFDQNLHEVADHFFLIKTFTPSSKILAIVTKPRNPPPDATNVAHLSFRPSSLFYLKPSNDPTIICRPSPLNRRHHLTWRNHHRIEGPTSYHGLGSMELQLSLFIYLYHLPIVKSLLIFRLSVVSLT